jgi:hypothetical protein
MTQFSGIRLAPFMIAGCVLAHFVRADEGMWLFNKPPVKALKSRYGFEPSPAWLEHVQKSCVRFSTGGSGSIVSADGLVMTNHHVGYDLIEKFSTPEKNLLETGFYAKTRAEELKCEDLELMVLWTIEDVTERVKSAASTEMSAADANTARRKMMSTIEQESESKSGLDCQVVTLYQGGMYHLYGYRQFTDVRLVMAPDEQAANFGGDTDNFEFPRHCLDMCFFRIYDNDKPLQPEHYLKWSRDGAADGELIFVAGHPGRTQRMFTGDHLKFVRDVELPDRLRRAWRSEVKLQTFSARNRENDRISSGDLLGVQNGRKAMTGMLAGLHDPAVLNKKLEAEKRLRGQVDSNTDYRGLWGDAWEQIAEAQRKFREFHGRHRMRISSDLYGKAMDLVRLAEEKPKPNAERLREYRDSELDSLYLELYSPAPIYDDLELHRLTSSLSHMAESLGGDDPTVVRALGGKSPRARAEELVRGTTLKDIAERKRLAEGGKEAIAASTDPMIRLALAMDPDSRAYRKRYEDEVEAAERAGYAKIAAARFAIEGADNYPDATFTLRLSFGAVRGYDEDGRKVAPFTTLGTTLQRAEDRKGEKYFDLSRRWANGKHKLNLDTPYNFVCTADIIGGNSGSPVVNREGEVVGLIFDGNIQSLVGDFAYDETQNRAVAVDSRGMIETMRKLYDAGPLADELTRN